LSDPATSAATAAGDPGEGFASAAEALPHATARRLAAAMHVTSGRRQNVEMVVGLSRWLDRHRALVDDEGRRREEHKSYYRDDVPCRG
jgi:hypothetical protein